MNKSAAFYPLYLIMGFNILTVFLFLFSPIIWLGADIFSFLVFITITYILIIVGYKKGINVKRSTRRTSFLNSASRRFTNYIFLFYSFTFIIGYAYLLRFELFDLSGMFRHLAIGIYDPQLGYNLNVNSTRVHTIPYTVHFIISIINNLFFIFGYFHYGKFSKIQKCLFVCFVIIDCLVWYGRGMGIGIIMQIITLASAYIFRFNIQKEGFSKLILSSLSLLIVSISIYGILGWFRGGQTNTYNIEAFDIGQAYIYTNSSFFSIIPEWLQFTYLRSIAYITQGYYALSLSFDLPFDWCYFFGGSPASMNLFEVFTGIDLFQNSYMVKLSSKNIDEYRYWHSAYLWFAHDVSIYGVPFLMGFISYMMGRSYMLSVTKDDLLSKIIFSISFTLLVLAFANNTYISKMYNSLIFIVPIWIYSRLLKS